VSQVFLSRSDLRWLIVGHGLIVLPHLLQIPLWVVLATVFTGAWRLLLLRRRRLPGWPLRMMLAAGAVVGIGISFGTWVGLEPMIAVLLVAAALKILECSTLRDAHILICLDFFIVATHFLFYQSPVMSVFVLASVAALLLCLIKLSLGAQSSLTKRHMGLVLRMLFWSAPLMATLFLTFPRIDPLWAVPTMGSGGATGMDDRLSPGSLSRIARSDQVAFRVRFDEAPPPRSEWYWRGMVLDRFEDNAWTTTPRREIPSEERKPPRSEPRSQGLHYELLQPPTHQPWLFALPYAQTSDPRVAEASAFHLVARKPMDVLHRIEVVSSGNVVMQQELSPWWRAHELALPASRNPQSRAYVESLREEVKTDEALITAVLDRFSREAFYYTLSPPLISERDFVDEFLFEVKRGFCEHYAYAFVVLMRQAGIPARIVGGYHGGELNPATGTVVVRQLDAHAWVEVWLPQRGWLRVDPTAAVAPNRIELGVEDALADEPLWLSESGLSSYRFRHYVVIDWLRWRYDDFAWRWQRSVVGFDQRQNLRAVSGWLARWGGLSLEIAAAAIWVGVLALLYILGTRSARRTPRSIIERRYLALCRRLTRHGVQRQHGESAAALRDRVLPILGAEHPLVRQLEAVYRELYGCSLIER